MSGSHGPLRPAGSPHPYAQLLAALSILIALLVMAIKFAAYWVTGSVALYSDALESIVNVAAAATAWFALRVSAQPADERHPFGHHKAEYLSAVLEGALIVVAALMILREAYEAFRIGRTLAEPALGLGLNAVAAVINAAWAYLLIGRGKAWRSPALVADGRHIFSDVLTSIGVIAGLLLVLATGVAVLDSLLAVGVAGYILWSGSRIIMQSVSGLLDEAVEAEVENRIRATIKAEGTGAVEAHDIRTRTAGRAVFIEFHLVVPRSMTVEAAHAICDRLEEAIEREIEGADVLIHIEPDHKAKPEATGVIDI